jgi:cell division ATPase FtsA
VDALFQNGLSDLATNGKCIRESAMYFSLGDATKYYRAEEMYSTPATSLGGGLCYYFIDEKFERLINETLQKLGVSQVEFLPQTLAQAIYLLPAKEREGYAFLLDVGFMNSSISVVYGDGVVHEESFSCGMASILVSLMESLKIDYETAEEILRSANIAGGGVAPDLMWTDESGASFPVAIINDVIKYGVDLLCERVQAFFIKHYREKESLIMNKTLWVTGEGVDGISGVAEHISRRLNHMYKIARPDLPYHDRASDSSRVALLAMAAKSSKKKGFKLFGGRKK